MVINFDDAGEIRTVQHEGAALVFYNPLPHNGNVKRIRTGVFRPITFNRPVELWAGEAKVPTLNYMGEKSVPIAINEGTVYVGIIPLMLFTGLQQARKANIQIQTYTDQLAVLFSSFEVWSPEARTYSQILGFSTGFVFEIQAASDFESFAAFRTWLANAEIADDYYADMRTTTYRRNGLTLSACYSPYQSVFRYATVNGKQVGNDPLVITGLPDPGCALLRK